MMHRFFLKRLKVLSSLLLIPTGLLFLCIMILTGTSQMRNIKETTRSSTENFSLDLESTINVCTSQQEMITFNSQLLLSMRKVLYTHETTYTDYVFLNSIKTFLGSISASHPLVDSIYLYLDDNSIFFSSEKTIRFLNSDADAGWYEIYESMPEDTDTYIVARQMNTSLASSVPEDVITVYKRFSYLNGVMVSNLSLEELEAMMTSNAAPWKRGLFLLDSDQKLLAYQGFSSAPDFTGTDLGTLTDGFHWVWIGHHLYLTYAQYQSDYCYYTVQLVPFSAVFLSCTKNLTGPLLMLLFTLFIIFLFSYQITRDNFDQIQSVIDLFSNAEKGIYPTEDDRPAGQPDDEYTLIMNNVIRMFLNTTFLNSQLAEQNYKKQAAELRALQLQINPHFMINTLQTLDFEVCKLAQGSSAANTIISNLSDILSYSLADPQVSVTIGDEITYIHKYVEIQKYRFLDSFYYFEEIDNSVLPHEFKRLLLQPLLENSISHGLRPANRQGMVKIKIFQREGWIHVSVTDNGVGIPRDRLASLRADLVSDTSTRIGLDNVNKRLTLTYGSESALHIHSKEGLGTCVFFHIPV